MAGDEHAGRLVGRTSVGAPVATRAMADDPRCRSVVSGDAAAYPDGRIPNGADILSGWNERRWPSGDAAWLLEGLELDRAGEDGSTLLVCEVSDAELAARLGHPDLWIWNDRAGGFPSGPGPFRFVADGSLEANPAHVAAGPWVERVRDVHSAETDPALMLRLGEADVAVLYGRSAAEMLREPPDAIELTELPSWDKSYALWLDTSRRWLNDPSFRRWLAGAIDRESAAGFLFAGAARPAWSLISPARTAAAWTSVARRPVSPGSTPRLSLRYDPLDPHAELVAQRLRAELGLHGIELLLGPGSGSADDAADMRLVVHRPPVADPLIALQQTLAGLADAPEHVRGMLRSSRGLADAEARRAAAELVENGLLVEARLIPILRLRAWLAHDSALRGVEPGPFGRLYLERAYWKRP
ncbi:MAG: hypothetical protein GY716_21530 [bacterium]|nr:hypothetical protein [bacterium]